MSPAAHDHPKPSLPQRRARLPLTTVEERLRAENKRLRIELTRAKTVIIEVEEKVRALVDDLSQSAPAY